MIWVFLVWVQTHPDTVQIHSRHSPDTPQTQSRYTQIQSRYTQTQSRYSPDTVQIHPDTVQIHSRHSPDTARHSPDTLKTHFNCSTDHFPLFECPYSKDFVLLSGWTKNQNSILILFVIWIFNVHVMVDMCQ